MKSDGMIAYIESCNRLGISLNGAMVRHIARRSGEDTSWYDASTCTDKCCRNHNGFRAMCRALDNDTHIEF